MNCRRCTYLGAYGKDIQKRMVDVHVKTKLSLRIVIRYPIFETGNIKT